MENNILPLFLKNPGDVSAQGAPVSEPHVDLEALTGAFSDLLQRTGKSLEGGLTIISDHAGRPITSPESESAAPKDEPIADNNVEARDRHDDNGRSDGDDAYRDAPRSDRRDDYGRDDSHTRQADHDGGAKRGDGDIEAVHRSDDRPQDQNQSAGSSNDSDAAATDSYGANSDRQNSDQGQNTAQNAKDNGAASQNEAAANAVGSGGAQVQSGLNNAEAVLGELLAAAEASFAGVGVDASAGRTDLAAAEASFAGVGVDASAGRTDGAAKNENSLQGLAKAIASLGSQNAQQQNGQANAQNNSPEMQALAKAVTDTKGDAKVINETGPSNNASTLQQQAQALSQAIGEGNRAKVNVNVTNESETLVSKTSSSLSPNAALSSDVQGLPLRAQQATAAANNPGAQQAAMNNAAQNQQAANQSTQRAISAISGDAKATGPVAQPASTHGGASGGGEGSSATSSQSGSQETREAQQNNQSQATNSNRANAQQKAVMDQITVNISRAVQAGLDKINIQLQPESLGKVDVSLEMAKDGKVSAVIHADNKDTLELLSRDAKELTKALQEAGLQLDESDIEFNLSAQSGEAGESDLAGGNAANGGDGDAADEAELAGLEDDFEEDIIEDDRVNIRV
jgi:flagellar hook-length control protein FliK